MLQLPISSPLGRRPPARVLSILAGAVLLLQSTGVEPVPPRPIEHPNVVFILADDMGWPDLACYGNRFHETPVLDRLASEGMRFTNFYAATPVCSSTRSTIQTGQYSARTGITDFIPGHWRPFEKLVVPRIDHHLHDDVRTPGDTLKKGGYVTGYFGKWHLGQSRDQQPDRRGYDVTERQLGPAFRRWRSASKRGPKSIDFLTEAAVWFIDQNQDRPFFLTVAHHAVHIPVEGRAETIAKYEHKTKPSTGVNHPVYAAMIENLDTSVGQILRKLTECKLAEKTIVIFTSDNGGLNRIYTGVGEEISTNAPLRDEKGTLYEGGIRVPLIIRWPRVVQAGTVSPEPATTADLLPTLGAMVGATLPDQPIDGTSLTDILRGKKTRLDRDAIYFHYPHYHHSRPASAIRARDWKLIEFLDDGHLELYDLNGDVSEARDQAAARPELARRLQRQLANWRQEVGARMPTANPEADPARAGEWWSRRTKQPLDVEAMRRRYDSRRARKQTSSPGGVDRDDSLPQSRALPPGSAP